jgi:FMN-dependent NADH-azoreductase
MEKKVLYINACARSESRTDRIARALLERLGGLQEEVKLAEMDLQPLSEERLNRRTRLIEKADYTDAMFDLVSNSSRRTRPSSPRRIGISLSRRS